MRRQRKLKVKENHERWLITYSDLITLLMIFFVVMYAMSNINQMKFVSLEQSLATALHKSSQIPEGQSSLLTTPTVSVSTKSGAGVAGQTQASQQDKSLDNLYNQVKQYIAVHHLNGNVTIVNQTRGVQITLRDVVLFDTGQAVLRPDAQTLLAGLVPFLQSLPNPIVVEGYTDNEPIHTAQFPSNWELSAARAIGVVEFLVGKGISPPRLSGVGYGQYHPIVPNNSAANRQTNRRVNIVILRSNQPVPGGAQQTETSPSNGTPPSSGPLASGSTGNGSTGNGSTGSGAATNASK